MPHLKLPMKTLHQLTLGTVLGILVSSAFAQTSIAPFTGDHSETFDEFPPQDVSIFLPNPTSAFDGTATLATILGPGGCCGLAVYDAGAHQFGNYVPTDGLQYAVTQDFGDTLLFTFSSLIANFGAYWGADTLHVEFQNANGTTVGSGNYTPAPSPDGTLQWLGWNLATPFKSVTVTSPTGNLIVLDSAQEGVPEPGSLALLVLGGTLIAGRRCRVI